MCLEEAKDVYQKILTKIRYENLHQTVQKLKILARSDSSTIEPFMASKRIALREDAQKRAAEVALQYELKKRSERF